MLEDSRAHVLTIDEVFGHSLDGIFLIDSRRRFVHYSSGCERITGYPASEVIGTQADCGQVSDCHDAVDRSLAGALCPSRQILSGGLRHALERMRIQHRHGHVVWIETAYSPVYDDHGNVVLIAGIMRNVSDSVDRENQLRETPMNRSLNPSEFTQAAFARTGGRGSSFESTVAGRGAGSLDEVLQALEKREIVAALQRADGQRTLAARLLGISRSRLYRRMEALGIDPRDAGDD